MSDPWVSQDSGAGVLPRPVRLAALPPPHRPREKALARGTKALGDTELLALILGSGGKGRPLLELAAQLVRRHGVRGLAALTPAGWSLEPGVGPARSARLAAAFELGRRAAAPDHATPPRITRPSDAWRLTRDLVRAKKEHLVGLYLDAQSALIRRETISIGSLNTTRTHPREIFYPAIAHLALGFILVHNHPSGSPEPSEEDVAFTRGVQRAAETIGIPLYDHVIVAASGFTSLRERGAF